jgi:hypothetical protein
MKTQPIQPAGITDYPFFYGILLFHSLAGMMKSRKTNSSAAEKSFRQYSILKFNL